MLSRVLSPAIAGDGLKVLLPVGSCNGLVEAMLVLAAAMFAFRASWRMKLVGLISGVLAIQAMNLARIVSLYYLGQWNQTVFEWAHLYEWQALIALDVFVVLLLWLRFLPWPRVADG